MEYKALEPSSITALSSVGASTNVSDASFAGITTFVYSLFFIGIIGAAFYRYTLAGMFRMEASESGIRKSNEIFKRVTLGLLGVFSLFILLFTVNKGLVTGDVPLGNLKSGGQTSGGQVVQPPSPAVGAPGTGSGSSGGSASCVTVSSVNQNLQSGNICRQASCTVLSGCNYRQYEDVIKKETGNDAKLTKMIIVTMCKESRAQVNEENRNPNGTYDCGLMQINQTTPCTAQILDVTQNIKQGVALMKEKIRYASRVYSNIPSEANVFASYNCCANGDNPASESRDCNTSSGFSQSIPKWACPINPGSGQFNMCAVSNYACELTACLNQL